MKMLIIQQSKLTRLLLTLLLEFTFVDKSTSNEAICTGRRIGNISYFKVDTVMNVTWTEAWKQCRKMNATLPVICNQNEQDDFARYLQLHMGSSVVWTSGRKNTFSEWTWVDGQTYRGTIPSRHEAYTYTKLTKDRHYEGDNPLHKNYYLCQYSDGDSLCSSPNATRVTSGCIVPGDSDGTWYDARNQCLAKGGDLAILKDDDLVTLNRSNMLNRAHWYWIGLRKDAWYWTSQDSESLRADAANEVKYSNWSTSEPSWSSVDCVSIDARYGGWASVRCTDRKRVVCRTTSSSKSPSSISSGPTMSRTTLSSVKASIPEMSKKAETTLSTRLTIPASSSKVSSPTSNWPTISSTTLSSAAGSIPGNSEKAADRAKKADSNVLLYAGLGAGIALIIICIIVILAVRYKRKPRREVYQSNVQTNNSEQNRQYVHVAPQHPANSPAGAYANSTPTDADDTKGVYAEISLAAGLGQSNHEPQTQQHPGIVYASLDFQKEPIYQEPDKKKPPSADPTKVGPMGDIYAMPDAKGRTATSPGNESTTSHPILVTSQGDVYALPIKDSKSPTAKQPPQEIYANTKA